MGLWRKYRRPLPRAHAWPLAELSAPAYLPELASPLPGSGPSVYSIFRAPLFSAKCTRGVVAPLRPFGLTWPHLEVASGVVGLNLAWANDMGGGSAVCELVVFSLVRKTAG